jgi:hypothetical protein
MATLGQIKAMDARDRAGTEQDQEADPEVLAAQATFEIEHG